MEVGAERREGRITKGYKETFAGDVYFHYPYCGDGFKGVYVCQNRLNCTL